MQEVVMPSRSRLALILIAAALAGGAAMAQRHEAADPANWVGAYSARFDGARGDFTIIRQRFARAPYRIDMNMAARGCTGRLEGAGHAFGRDRLVFTIPSEFGGETCRVTLTRGRNGIRVGEEHCLEYHGAACAFDGTARRRR
jgi:hypothetical protein